MKRHTPYRLTVASLALLGLVMSSTVTAWAAICADDCVAMMPSCCDEEQAAQLEDRITAASCCTGDERHACATVVAFDAGVTQAAHHYELPALALVSAVAELSVEAPRAVCRVAPSPIDPAPPRTETIVLLL